MIDAFLPEGEATELLARLQGEIPWDERMKARKTACFGQTYDDSGVTYEVTQEHWTHAVKKASTEGSRISLTFRHILNPQEMALRATRKS